MAINGANGTETGIGSVLAWQLSLCEDGTPSMGLCRQHSDTSNSDSKKVNECYGAFGYFAGGPLQAGEKIGGGDQHQIGVTSEGKAIYAGHLPTTSLFQMPDANRTPGGWKGRGEVGDAPLHFEESSVSWEPMLDKGFPRKTHLAFDEEIPHRHSAYGQRLGKWVFYTLVPQGGSSGGPPTKGDDDDDEDEGSSGIQDFEPGRWDENDRQDSAGVPPLGGKHPDGEPEPKPESPPREPGPVSGGGGGDPGYIDQPINGRRRRIYAGGRPPEWLDAESGFFGPDDPNMPTIDVDENGNEIPPSNPSGGTVTSGDIGPIYYKGTRLYTEDEHRANEKGGKGGGSGDGNGSGYLATPFQHSFADTKAKGGPNSVAGGASGGASPNLKDYRSRISQNSLMTWMNRAPITGIQTAFYGYNQNWRDPVYTQKPRSEGGDGKYKSGTADGGWFIRQPESDVTDLREQNATDVDPTWIHTGNSNTIWGMLPGIRSFQGYPDMSTGDIKKGYYSTLDYATNKVEHSVKEFDGTTTNFLSYPGDSTEPVNVKVDILGDQDIEWKSGTSFKGALEHNNSADRTYTFPNASGTVALTSDIPSGAGLWTLAADVVKTTTNTHHVAFNDNVLNHGVTDTNTGFKINADVWSVETGGTQAFTADSAQTLNVTNQISWKDNTSYKGILTHANTSADKTYTFPDNSGTVALRTGLDIGQVIYGSPNASESLYLRGNSSDDSGIEIDSLGNVYTDSDYYWYSGTANLSGIVHASSSPRTWTFPNETGQVKLKKDKIAFFPSNQSTTFSKHSVDALTTSGGFGYIEFLCPNDFSSITSLVAIVIASATDASVDIDLESEYGASTQDHATHTGSSTGTTYSLTEGRLTEISLTSVFASLAVGDYCGIEVQNNDAATTVYLVGVRMAYTPTD